MVTCGKCQLQNSLDSSFCRKCGTALDADLLQQAKSELGRTVAQGFVLFNEGKVEEAGLIAEMALGEDPTLTTAISLKGMCHERKGELAEALAAYEKVLEFAPDSALDRIKVSQLRAAISAKASLVEEERAQPDKKMALMVAVLAVVFFSGVGALGFKLVSGSQTRQVSSMNTKAEESPVVESFKDPTPAPKTTSATPAPAPTQGGIVGNVRPVEPANNPSENADSGSNQNKGEDNGGGLTPIKPVGNGISGTLPSVSENVLATTQLGPSPSRSSDPEPTVTSERPQTASTTVAPKSTPEQDPVDDPGQIEISVSNRTPKNVGGSQVVDDGTASQNLGKVASQEFQLKRYDSAAKKYEKLLKSGGDSAHINQRLAQCYENLGKKSDAVSAYQRAAKALKDNIQSGRGNVARQKAALESCEAAIKVLNEGV